MFLFPRRPENSQVQNVNLPGVYLGNEVVIFLERTVAKLSTHGFKFLPQSWFYIQSQKETAIGASAIPIASMGQVIFTVPIHGQI